MKTISFFSKLSLFVLVLAATSCGNTSKKTKVTEAQATTEEHMQQEGHAMQSDLNDSMFKDGPEYTSKYVCPMHCQGSGSESEGKCPVCGMTYVVNENYNEAVEHDANHNH